MSTKKCPISRHFVKLIFQFFETFAGDFIVFAVLFGENCGVASGKKIFLQVIYHRATCLRG